MPIDTAAIRALADAATPGLWHPGIDEDTGHSYVAEPGGTTVAVFFSSDATGKHGPANAAFIAAARTAVPALCDELDALRAKVAKLRELAAEVEALPVPSYYESASPHDPGIELGRCEGGKMAMRDMLAILDEVNNA